MFVHYRRDCVLDCSELFAKKRFIEYRGAPVGVCHLMARLAATVELGFVPNRRGLRQKPILLWSGIFG